MSSNTLLVKAIEQIKNLDFKGALNNLEVLYSINGKLNRVKYKGSLFIDKMLN